MALLAPFKQVRTFDFFFLANSINVLALDTFILKCQHVYSPPKMKETKLITLDKTYLKEKFVEYNQLYFNNSLPKVPIFSIINTPHLAGQYCARWGKKNGVLQIIRHEIQIDENILWTEEKLRSVLVHEMIHYYVETKKKKPKREGDFQHWGLFWVMKTKLNWKYNLHIKNREII